jgi:hypothetical protein
VLRDESIKYFLAPKLTIEALGSHLQSNILSTETFLSMDRLKQLAVVKSEAQVREALFTCLRVPALVWHSIDWAISLLAFSRRL